MIPLVTILTFPDGTPIEAAQGTLDGVYEYRRVSGQDGPTTVQSATLKDVGGNQLRMTVWGHPDLAPMKGREVVVYCKPNGGRSGVKVKHGSFEVKNEKAADYGKIRKTVELSVSKSGQFQFVEVYKSTVAPEAPVAGNPSHSEAPGGSEPQPAAKTSVNGQKVGMLVNNAVLIHTTDGTPTDLQSLKATVKKLMALNDWIEQGCPDAPVGDEAPF